MSNGKRVRYFEPERKLSGGAILFGLPEVPTAVSELINDAGYVDAAGAAAAAPVQSVNGQTGTVVVNPITTWTPSSTATALQVIAHAQANPGLIFCWARYQAATYTPVNTSAAWTYTLYTNYSTDANYVIFEAENNTTGRLYRCDAFGDWHELVRAEDVRYKAGDTFTVADVSAAIPGYITTSGKAIHLSVPVDKSMANISSVSVTALKGYIRHAGGGYVDASGATNIDWKGSSYTVAADKASPNLVHISITKTTAFTNVTNNTPVVYQPSALTLSFS